MARKKKRRAHKKNPRRSSHKRAAVAPQKRKRSRAHKPNPSKRTRKRSHARAKSHKRVSRHNPGKRRRSGRRAHRRNPMNPYVGGFLAVLLSLGVGAVEGILPALIIPKDFDLQQKVRMGAGAVGTIAGLALVKNHPVLGLAIAAPSFAVLASGTLNEWISKALAPSSVKSAPKVQSGLVRQIGAVYHQNMAALVPSQRSLGAVYHQDMAALVASQRGPMGAVFHESMGDTHPGAPWNQRTPFG